MPGHLWRIARTNRVLQPTALVFCRSFLNSRDCLRRATASLCFLAFFAMFVQFPLTIDVCCMSKYDLGVYRPLFRVVIHKRCQYPQNASAVWYPQSEHKQHKFFHEITSLCPRPRIRDTLDCSNYLASIRRLY